MTKRWWLVSEWTDHRGDCSHWIIEKFWTQRGARNFHNRLVGLLRSRNGQAAIILCDTKTKRMTRLSVQ